MKKKEEDSQHKEEWFVNELLQKHVRIYKAPEGFTNKFMQAFVPTHELSPAIKKPILNVKGKLTALMVFVLLFIVGISIGHEITEYVGFTTFNEQISQIFKLDYTIMMTTILFSFSILLLFNELLRKYFVRRSKG